jgi:hypothetical protein
MIRDGARLAALYGMLAVGHVLAAIIRIDSWLWNDVWPGSHP